MKILNLFSLRSKNFQLTSEKWKYESDSLFKMSWLSSVYFSILLNYWEKKIIWIKLKNSIVGYETGHHFQTTNQVHFIFVVDDKHLQNIETACGACNVSQTAYKIICISKKLEKIFIFLLIQDKYQVNCNQNLVKRKKTYLFESIMVDLCSKQLV